MSLHGKTLFITGGSRGIGLAIALRAAHDIEQAGGRALPLALDIRDENAVAVAVKQATEHFGGIDILLNNASAIQLTDTEHTAMKRFDLMFGVNVRGTFACTQACLPYLKQSALAGRKPEIMADAAYYILTSDASTTTGNFFVDDEVLARHGVTDFDAYAVIPGNKNLLPDFFLD